MSVQFQFAAGTVEALGGSLPPIPEGEYLVAITASEQITKEDKGAIQFTLKVQEGEFAGRELNERANIAGYSEKAIEMGMMTLESICRATGTPGFSSTGELHGKPFRIGVIIEEQPSTKDPSKMYKSNRIRGWKNAAGVSVSDITLGGGGAAPAAAAAPAAPAAPTQAVPAAPAAPAAPAGGNPWG